MESGGEVMAGDSNNPQSLPNILAGVGGLTLGLLGALVIAPQLFPRAPGEGFNVSQMLCAGACGAGGALLGWVVGKLIESISGKG
jgi:hypothetical protein